MSTVLIHALLMPNMFANWWPNDVQLSENSSLFQLLRKIESFNTLREKKVEKKEKERIMVKQWEFENSESEKPNQNPRYSFGQTLKFMDYRSILLKIKYVLLFEQN